MICNPHTYTMSRHVFQWGLLATSWGYYWVWLCQKSASPLLDAWSRSSANMGTSTAAHLLVHCQVHGNFMIMTSARGLGHLELEATWNFSNNRCNPQQQGQRHIMLWGPPKIFKTSIIVGRNRSHTFSFKSWPPYEKNLAPPPIRSNKNAPPQIPTFHLFDFSFHSLRHVSHIPQFFSWVRPYPMAIQRPML